MAEKISKVKVIKQYFDMSASEAMAELKELDEPEKLELATLAADALGIPEEARNW